MAVSMNCIQLLKYGCIIDCEAFNIGKQFLYRDLSVVSVQDSSQYLRYDFYTTRVKYQQLTEAEKKQVRFCNKLHGMKIENHPKEDTYRNFWLEVDEIPQVLNNIIEHFPVVAYKGGVLERNLLVAAGIPHIDLEKLGCPKADKIRTPCPKHENFHSHCSLCDVYSYRSFVVNEFLAK